MDKLFPGWIPAQALDNIQYQYKSPDNTLFEDWFLQKWWNWSVNLFPETIHPNVLTVAGFMCSLIPFMTFVSFDPTFSQELPSWLYFVTGVFFFCYQTLDGIDGK